VEIANIIRRDPFKLTTNELKNKKAFTHSVEQLAQKSIEDIRKSMGNISASSHHSIDQIRNMLNPTHAPAQKLSVIHRHEKKKVASNGMPSSAVGSKMSMNSIKGSAHLPTMLPFKLSSIIALSDNSMDITGSCKEIDMLIPLDTGSDFRALPYLITRFCPSTYIAFIGFMIMLISICQVIISMAT
jgi:hypothetical protein